MNLRRAKHIVVTALALASLALPARAQQPSGLDRISHIVVVFLENRSFDNMFGAFPSADGVENAIKAGKHQQRDLSGKLYEELPPPIGAGAFDVSDNSSAIRSLPWPKLPNAPFAIDKTFPSVGTSANTRDLVHRFYTNRAQINSGANDRFVAYSDAGGLAMGYYSKEAMENSALWKLARENTLLDHFFMGALGGSFLNHIYLACACGPVWTGAPDKERSKIDANGAPLAGSRPGVFEDNRVVATADGDIAINTIQSVYLNNGKQSALLPPQTQPTIGDRLSDKNVDWAWYSEGLDLASRNDRSEKESNFLEGSIRFQWHHQAFSYFKRFDPATEAGRAQREHHLRDAARLDDDIAAGKLPPVVFYKPSGPLNQHPGYANLDKGDARVAEIAAKLAASPIKDSYVMIITYDENGGFWDHVAPPAGAGDTADFLGPGSRVPALVISPFARKGVDSTPYDTGSVLKLITERFRLEPLPGKRVQAVNSLSKSLKLD
ncbi:alkaline phosphatase family protein [Terrarubrum flagellatum]|uniref:alkaline phosphatase family protein n=1 Tax=Terrirubrum flagellatum TaxID=2895980 RepID=UPI0031451A8F